MKKLTALFAIILCSAVLFPVGTTLADSKISNASARSQVYGDGMSVSSSGGCQDRYNSTCTSLEQVWQHTISDIITFHHASGCGVTITGGTEVGHASGTYSHWNGYKLDISRTTCVTNWIHSAYTYIGPRSGDGAPQYRSAAGNIYADEGSHWDILYYS